VLLLLAALAAVSCVQAQLDQNTMLGLVNVFRSRNGRATLQFDARIATAAQKFARELASRCDLTHTGLDGSTPSRRIAAEGVDWSATAENVAYGQDTMAIVEHAWENHDGHRENLLSTSVRYAGFGFALGTGGECRGYKFWVQDFANFQGAPVGGSVQAPKPSPRPIIRISPAPIRISPRPIKISPPPIRRSPIPRSIIPSIRLPVLRSPPARSIRPSVRPSPKISPKVSPSPKASRTTRSRPSPTLIFAQRNGTANGNSTLNGNSTRPATRRIIGIEIPELKTQSPLPSPPPSADVPKMDELLGSGWHEEKDGEVEVQDSLLPEPEQPGVPSDELLNEIALLQDDGGLLPPPIRRDSEYRLKA